ncbi:phosphoribosylformylglycinamidine synthase [Youngiibacter fragilis]|uniref:phosphoribosylformylglycinamidine synthase n=1 Tax=Youngiibacter fragilis TaxID=1408819 RepID=UPI0003F6E0A1|nr:phosphoribosylformylglycinamidine synthase [Youngiibacter fragilis]
MDQNIYVEKKEGYRNEAEGLKREIREMLGIETAVRIINIYTVYGLDEKEIAEAKAKIFSEPSIDTVYEDSSFIYGLDHFVLEPLPGQFDARAKASEECIQLLLGNFTARVSCKKLYGFTGINARDIKKVRDYVLNPVEMREGSIRVEPLHGETPVRQVETVKGFRYFNQKELMDFLKKYSLAMTYDDLHLIQDYFMDEKRDPSITEIKVFDTYWSDHCRHTTFNTVIRDVEFLSNSDMEKAAYERYVELRKSLRRENKPVTLMDIATIGARYLKARGLVKDLDVSEEINACSIEREIDTSSGKKNVLIMFKNETHNHPTEIEPFGGAATCLGGAIRDPLSGRSYVYQGMRITGSGDPRKPLKDTLPGKLPQRVITKGAARGFSSYGNQIGLNTGFVEEVYHDGYVAKRMEVGAVIGSALKENVVRETPMPGDVVILIGGRTGRDGIGGATGSSKIHSDSSLQESGSEVQKGNPVEERKIQRFFRNEEAAGLIVRCNDFGAGGVSVAIGELADSLDIYLDRVPKKYQGLDPTEIAISESQERMAVVSRKGDAQRFMELASEENLESTVVAEITDSGRLRMIHGKDIVVDIRRRFLNTNGASAYTSVAVDKPSSLKKRKQPSSRTSMEAALKDLKSASQKGLLEMFDTTIGRSQVVLPYGGTNQDTKSQGMVSLIPLKGMVTDVATVMTYGFDPDESSEDTFTGAYRAVVESLAKMVTLGASHKDARLSFQEYFERLGTDSKKWGKPFSSLLGALSAQLDFKVPAIGGKDSMSGTFNDISVPPTLISFAVNTVNVHKVITNDLKAEDSILAVLRTAEKDGLYSSESFNLNAELIFDLRDKNLLLSADTLKRGLFRTLTNMALGNRTGFKVTDSRDLFLKDPGSFVIQVKKEAQTLLAGSGAVIIGTAANGNEAVFGEESFTFDDIKAAVDEPLRKVFSLGERSGDKLSRMLSEKTAPALALKVPQPRVLIPVFPGSNCEYDLEQSFTEAGGKVSIFVFRNSEKDLMESIRNLAKAVRETNILMIPGGFSAGDEPEGSGKYIANILRNPEVKDEVMNLIRKRDGLILGICNGFQGLVKSGLLPYGEIIEPKDDMPNLTYNTTGKHMSLMSRTMVVSRNTPWLSGAVLGQVYDVPISHGEGRFVADEKILSELMKNGQIATRYVGPDGMPTMEAPYNPNGSMMAVEGITSPDGRVFGKMGHTERYRPGLYKNYKGTYLENMFKSGVDYFK